MPAELDVDREQVRMLVLAVGPRQAAREMGLKEDVVRQWSSRFGWLKHLRETHISPPSMVSVTSVTKAPDALVNVLLQRQGQSKLNLSEYLVEASAAAAKLKGPVSLESAPLVKTLGDLHSRIYPEVTSDQSTHISFFSISGQFAQDTEEKPVYDAQPASEPSDDPEDY